MTLRKTVMWVLLIAIVASLSLITVSSAPTENWTADQPLPQPTVVKGRQFHLGYLLVNLTSESCQRDYIQVQIEVKHRGWKLSYNVSAEDVPKQRAAMQNLMEKKVDAIILNYAEMEPLRDLILEARKKGIGVYCNDTELKPGVIINVTQPNGVVGAQMAIYMIDRLQGKGGVAVLNILTHILRQRCYAAKGLLSSKVDWPNLDLLAWEDMPVPGWEKDAYNTTAAWIQKFGKKLNAIFAGWDTPGVFAARAIQAAGLSQKDIFVTGIDGGAEAYDMIRSGSPFVATMSQPFEQYIHDVFEIIVEIQVKGIGIGEKGSTIPRSLTKYDAPVLTTMDNLPPVGANIHSVLAGTYYDPKNKSGWWTWGDKDGKTYKVTSTTAK